MSTETTIDNAQFELINRLRDILRRLPHPPTGDIWVDADTEDVDYVCNYALMLTDVAHAGGFIRLPLTTDVSGSSYAGAVAHHPYASTGHQPTRLNIHTLGRHITYLEDNLNRV